MNREVSHDYYFLFFIFLKCLLFLFFSDIGLNKKIARRKRGFQSSKMVFHQLDNNTILKKDIGIIICIIKYYIILNYIFYDTKFDV